MTTTPVPTEFLDFLGRKYADRVLNDAELLSIVEETWAMAQVPPRFKTPTIVDMATAHAKRSAPLTERLHFVRKIVRDTLDKMSGEVPPELKWATYGSSVSAVGIFRKHKIYGSVSDITGDIRSGKTAAEETDYVRVSAMTDRYKHTTVTADLPLSSLSSNPMVIAQATRTACREHAETVKAKVFAAEKQERINLRNRIAVLQADLVDLDEKIAVKNVERQERADVTIAQAKVQGEELRAERAARRAEKLAAERSAE